MVNAKRQARFRMQQKIVTHQGSLSNNDSALLKPSEKTPTRRIIPPFSKGIFCVECGNQCDPFVRNGFIGKRRRE